MVNEKWLVQTLASQYQTYNPFVLCRELGIQVIFTELAGIRGFYHHELDTDAIYIESSLSTYESEFICAHELGHALLHGDTNAAFLANHTYQVMGKFEKAADHFAAILLWPDDNELLEYSHLSLGQLSNLMGMPEDLIKWRYNQIKT